mmetsp:Transcript_14483/g.30995  ORF Transcript_14483/g.30995 Transcript_14483/m.30995 type:complete len:360 (-) Transcript_14483:626-1705(-)|eukprot:CAMPEP_0118946588 /NCGR_PEP_ID=MMETSP1169-20130426/44457_1 /TAXON_ID=36882 /ORGANISM="Pyramimonas obovata, Strain CCMP722" /LENGTH=359 /DNA_ID=CAMNT_0006892595 /DNA_START=194 /DNA_END=1273 /DNA_ORIENTATION=-
MAMYNCGSARCITALKHPEKTRYLVGTLKLRDPNEIHLIEYDAENEAIRCVNIYGHKHEIWHLSPCQTDESKLFTCYNTGSDYRASLWKIPSEDDNAHASGTLKHLATLDPILVQSPVRCVLWSPHGPNSVLSVDEEALRSWSIEGGDINATGTSEQAEALHHKLAGGAWDPHDSATAVTWAGNNLSLWDLRTMRQRAGVEGAHGGAVRDVDFNPKRPHVMASAGDDGKVRFWDVRSACAPLLEFAAHAHWVWQVKFNPAHDRLLLTSSSDTDVALWRVASLAGGGDTFPTTAQPVTPGGSRSDGNDGDQHLQTFSDHEDSVYGAAWSAVDPWAFATVAHDGRVLVHSVPRAEKYKILL